MKEIIFLLSLLAATSAAAEISFADVLLKMPPILAKGSSVCSAQNCAAPKFCCAGTCRTGGLCCNNTYYASGYCCNGAYSSTPCSAACTTDANCATGSFCCAGTCRTGGLCCNNTYYASGYCCNGVYSTTPCGSTVCTRSADCGSAGAFCCGGSCYTTGLCCNNTHYTTGSCGNDTCITTKAGSSNQEDADHGRDKTHNHDEDGLAGLSFTKLDSSGAPLADQTKPYAEQPWDCVKDNVTGLIWEIKAEPEERPWYNDDPAANGGLDGTRNGGYNTQGYAVAANASGLCGALSGWRLPTIKELLSIVNSSKTNMAADQNYFPGINASNKRFWSATPSVVTTDRVWGVNFEAGSTDRLFLKSDLSGTSVILVRTAN